VNKPFGERLLQANRTSAQSLEQAEGRGGLFASLDAVTGHFLERSLAAERVAEIAKQNGNDQLNLLGVTEDEHQFIRAAFLLSDQQKHGAWFLPEQCNVRIGDANLPYRSRRYARFASQAAYNERLKVDLRNSPEGLYFWVVLEPLFETLFRPIALRTTEALTGNRDEQIRAWKKVDTSFANLGISSEIALTCFASAAAGASCVPASKLRQKPHYFRV
jgi:hypothetical protein